MAAEDRRQKTLQRTQLEQLEDRIAMAADVALQMHGGSEFGFGNQAFVESSAEDVSQTPVAEINEELLASQELELPPDFYIDRSLEWEYISESIDLIEQSLGLAHDQTGLTSARTQYDFTGVGQTVAVIDSGIAWDHLSLGDGYGSSYRVVGGWDFTENDADPYDDGAAGSHGTHVAGIIGSDNAVHTGVAPGVDLVGLRVFNDDGAGYFSWVENALQWVHANQDSFENPITAVNLSLGTNWNSTEVPGWAMLEDDFAALEADGIFVAVSAGNSFTSYNTPGLSYPAASSHVVPVMSTDDNGGLSYFSQRHQSAIAAPGRTIASTVPDYIGNNNGIADDFASYSGTSMASPYVAGASVLVREAMEFYGTTTTINQGVIYEHMRATADTVYDPNTQLEYLRLNLGEALSALETPDEFGSTYASATSIGTVVDSQVIEGLIGNMEDADYVNFVASVTGQMVFTASATHRLEIAWSDPSGIGTLDQDSFVVDVVAGESYTFGIDAAGGMGHYSLQVEAIEEEAAFEVTDLGAVADLEVTDIAVSGEAWYRIAASQTGYLTIVATTGSAMPPGLQVTVYDAEQNEVASSFDSLNHRVDWNANAGTEYFVQVSGVAESVDLRFFNLVGFESGVLTLVGTEADDEFSYRADGAMHHLAWNGLSYEIAAGEVNEVRFSGGGGVDRAVVHGGSQDESVTLRRGSLEYRGTDLTIQVDDVYDLDAHSGGGADELFLYDTAGDEDVIAEVTEVTLTGEDYENTGFGFARTYTFASGGFDEIWQYDSAGDDLLRGWSDRVVLSGDGFYNYANGFDKTYAFGSQGEDTVQLYDSAGDDLYRTWDDRVVMSGDGFYNYAHGFDRTYAYASEGEDSTYSYDTPGDDLLRSWADRIVLSGENFYNYAQGFDRTYVYATEGFDRSYAYDSTGDDLYRAWTDRVVVSGDDFYNYAQGFDRTYAYASEGHDRAYSYDSAGDDLYRAWTDRVVMSGDAFYNYAQGFDRTYAYASQGDDSAYSYDSAGDDLYRAWTDRTVLSGNGFYNYVQEFDRSYVYASTGNDVVQLYDSAQDDLYRVWSNRVVMSGVGFYNYAEGFDSTLAEAESGGVDSVIFYDSTSDDAIAATEAGVVFQTDDSVHTATGFEEVTGISENGGEDSASTDSIDYLFNLLGEWDSSSQ